MAITDELLFAFEAHSPAGIRKALAGGADPNSPIGGKMPIIVLLEMYTRTSRFAECVRVMMDAGAALDSPVLQAILLDDADQLRRLDTDLRFNVECACTSLRGVSPLHVCGEYNSVQCARVLVERESM